MSFRTIGTDDSSAPDVRCLVSVTPRASAGRSEKSGSDESPSTHLTMAMTKSIDSTELYGDRGAVRDLTVGPAPVWHFDKFKKAWNSATFQSQLPFCIAKNVTHQEYLDMCESHEGLSRRWEFEDGEVWMFKATNNAHDFVATSIQDQIRDACKNGKLGVVTTGSPTHTNPNGDGAHWSKQPDAGVMRAGTRPPPESLEEMNKKKFRWPNIIIEVANSQDENNVRLKSWKWLKTAPNFPDYGVQQVVVIKIDYVNGSEAPQPMKAMRFDRGCATGEAPHAMVPLQEIQVRNEAGCLIEGPGADGQMILIPTTSLFAPEHIPDGVGANLAIDLYYVNYYYLEGCE